MIGLCNLYNIAVKKQLEDALDDGLDVNHLMASFHAPLNSFLLLSRATRKESLIELYGHQSASHRKDGFHH